MGPSFRVLVTGGRNYDNTVVVYAALDSLLDQVDYLTVVEGGASGADQMARAWTTNNNRPHAVTSETHKADWPPRTRCPHG